MFYKLKTKNHKLNRGMTYIELIVVLVIFFTMSAVVLFNSSNFKSTVEIKTLSNDIALKIVEAQKSAVAGKLPPLAQQQYLLENWKPSYGVYFNVVDNKKFTYFTDLSQNYSYEENPELFESFNITRGNFISSLKIFSPIEGPVINNLSLIFTRPNSGTFFNVDGVNRSDISYAQITVSSSGGITNTIKVYSSGRIQIN